MTLIDYAALAQQLVDAVDQAAERYVNAKRAVMVLDRLSGELERRRNELKHCDSEKDQVTREALFWVGDQLREISEEEGLVWEALF